MYLIHMYFDFYLIKSLGNLPLRYVDGSGVNRVSGGADLKGSQHYPKLFGMAVAELYQQNRGRILQDVTHQLNLVYN